MSSLDRFWELLETNFPLGGARARLRDLLGAELEADLEDAGLLRHRGVSETYPCPTPAGDGCPRQVIERSDGSYLAVCGNDPPECLDVTVTSEDIAQLGVVPTQLCKALQDPFLFGGAVEEMAGVRRVWRAGTFVPGGGVRHPVFLVVCTSTRDYSEALHALRSLQEGAFFAVLVPTDRFVGEDLVSEMGQHGVPVIALRGLVNLEGRALQLLGDAAELLGTIGQRRSLAETTGRKIVARVRTHDGWSELDEPAYDALLAEVDEFDVVADELTRTAWKRGGRRHTRTDGVRASFFAVVRAAVERKGYFDPSTEGPLEEADTGKQTFQRARRAIDLKVEDERGSESWRLLKTVKTQDGTRYHFQPDEGFRFALIFQVRA